MQRHGRERSHGINHQQRSEFVRHFPITVYSRQHARRSFALRQANHLNLLALACAAHVFCVHWLPIGRSNLYYFGRGARGNLVHPLGEHAVHGDDRLVTLLQHIDDGRFNPPRPRSRQRHGDAVFRLENLAQQDLRFVHAPLEPGVHVAHQRRGESAVHARIDGRRPRRQHQSSRGIEFSNVLSHDLSPSYDGYLSRYLERTAHGF